MRRVLYLLVPTVLLLMSTTCEDEIAKESSVLGTWEITQRLADSGDGSGIFRSVDDDKQITFNAEGIVSSDDGICFGTSNSENQQGTFNSTDQTITSENCNATYEIEGNTLTIYYFCFEGCGERYKRVD